MDSVVIESPGWAGNGQDAWIGFDSLSISHRGMRKRDQDERKDLAHAKIARLITQSRGWWRNGAADTLVGTK
jgi:hypothetical protein